MKKLFIIVLITFTAFVTKAQKRICIADSLLKYKSITYYYAVSRPITDTTIHYYSIKYAFYDSLYVKQIELESDKARIFRYDSLKKEIELKWNIKLK